ncbi:MAG: hypothetical protein D6732_04395, partial [Methanobacteriota archaeon]
MLLLASLVVLAQKGPGGVGNTDGTTTLKLWLKADAGVTLSGSNVSDWADQSGNANDATQSNAADQPLFVSSSMNGQPALQFSDDIMSGTNILASDNQATVFVVV